MFLTILKIAIIAAFVVFAAAFWWGVCKADPFMECEEEDEE